MNSNIPVLIPAYKPDHKLLELIDQLQNLNIKNIVVVRDGGNESFDELFKEVKNKNCHLCVHDSNLGKGRALKTGLTYIQNNFSQAIGVITADADGQHSPEDIAKVIDALERNSTHLILGVRVFDETTPLRSKFGNLMTRGVFRLLLGKKISDTQTGLRGIPRIYFSEFINLEGEQYEYETNMLIATKKMNIDITEVPIKTIYIENNRSSHFRPIIDSVKIYYLLLRFSFSGIASFIIDYSLFVAIIKSTDNLAYASYISRAISMIFNFTVNKNIVFKFHGSYLISFTKYLLTCLFSISISYLLLLYSSTKLNLPILPMKILIEIGLFFLNFYIQNKFIFKRS